MVEGVPRHVSDPTGKVLLITCLQADWKPDPQGTAFKADKHI